MTLEIASVISIGGFLIAVFNFYFNNKKTNDEKTKRDTEISVKLTNLTKDIEEIKIDLKQTRLDISKDRENLIRLESTLSNNYKNNKKTGDD